MIIKFNIYINIISNENVDFASIMHLLIAVTDCHCEWKRTLISKLGCLDWTELKL